jgi:RNA polymerase sigma-70 factor (ECF subfamily)
MQPFVALFSSKERRAVRILQTFLDTFERLYGRSGANRFGFTAPEFCEMLAGVMCQSLSEQAAEEFLRNLRLDDLVLARACARGNEAAWAVFVATYREKLYRAARAIAPVESVARELADSVYADLFGTRLGKDGRRISKLESYLGRGSLEGWLRMVLAQDYVNRFRVERRLIGFVDAIDCRPPAGPAVPENAKLASATDAALMDLSSEERLLLAAHYLDGRTLAEIGRMLCVHESTISRRLEKIVAALRKKIVKKLCEAGIGRRDAEGMLAADVRDLNLDIRGRLTQERQGESI